MKLEDCEKCPHLTGDVCGRKGRPIAKVRGCSLSAVGKQFFRAVSGQEAYRLKFINRNPEEK
jgi:hypothetical protein